MSKVSIVIPVYNTGKNILSCLKSIEDQSYTNIEVIIVNDGSTDNTVELIDDYRQKSELSIRLFNQENSGVSRARNEGFSKTIGEYVCFIDSDDMIHPKFIETLLLSSKKSNTNLSISSFRSISEKITDINQLENCSKVAMSDVYDNTKIMKDYLLGEIQISIWSILINREVIEKNKMCFNENAKYSEDMEFVWKLLAYCKKISFTDSELYYYRENSISVMSKISGERKSGFILFKNLEDFLHVNEPNFYDYFEKFGLAKWVWSTIWQIAVASDDYSVFKEMSQEYEPKTYLKKLISFPNKKVSISSIVFCISPFMYYRIIKFFGNKRLKERRLFVE